MSSFSVDTVESLDYDFTGFPSETRTGKMCTAKGVIPEPSEKALKTYQAGLRKMFGIDSETDPEKASKAVEKASEGVSEKQSEERNDTLLGLVSTLCSGTPTKEDLEELPPRIKTAFIKWVQATLANPKVMRGDTQG